MLRASACGLVLSFILVSACGAPQAGISTPQQPADQIHLYSDQEAEKFARRLEQYKNDHSGKFPDERFASYDWAFGILRQIGVDIVHLESPSLGIGNCINTASYQLSPNYNLFIDNNSCFPGARGIVIDKSKTH